MRSYTYTIQIDRSPEHVWAYMMDFSKAPRWRNLVREIEVLTPAPRRFGVRNTEQNVTGVFEYTLTPQGPGTIVTFTCDIKPHGWMWLLLPLMLRSNRARYQEQLPRLKHEVEKGAA
jgi:hypothetical protein